MIKFDDSLYFQVYEISFYNSETVMIGMTTNYKKRMNNYLSKLYNGEMNNQMLSEAWTKSLNKNGHRCFRHKVIASCDNWQDAKKLEVFYMNKAGKNAANVNGTPPGLLDIPIHNGYERYLILKNVNILKQRVQNFS